jgi:DUF177 domain-containing protein
VRAVPGARAPRRPRRDRATVRRASKAPRSRRPAPPREEDEEAADELDAFDGETVVLDDAVREQILLEVPMNPLCREDCPGLCAESPKRSVGSHSTLAAIVSTKKE